MRWLAIGALAAWPLVGGCSVFLDGGNETGEDDASMGADRRAPGMAKLMFVTSDDFQGGELAGLEGADDKCSAAAATAGLAGRFLAWVSDSTGDALTRIGGKGPWRLPDRNELAFGMITDGPVQPLDVDEMGGALAGVQFWTGTAGDGMVDPGENHCDDWGDVDGGNGTIGDGGNGGDGSDPGWTISTTIGCDEFARLLCFEVD